MNVVGVEDDAVGIVLSKKELMYLVAATNTEYIHIEEAREAFTNPPARS